MIVILFKSTLSRKELETLVMFQPTHLCLKECNVLPRKQGLLAVLAQQLCSSTNGQQLAPPWPAQEITCTAAPMKRMTVASCDGKYEGIPGGCRTGSEESLVWTKNSP